jgi:hypothetical protein
MSNRGGRITRDLVLFVSGLGLIVHEAVGRGNAEPRWSLLIIYAGMVGLPAVFTAEQKLRQAEERE